LGGNILSESTTYWYSDAPEDEVGDAWEDEVGGWGSDVDEPTTDDEVSDSMSLNFGVAREEEDD